MADGGSEDDVTEAGTDPDDDLQILKLGPEYAASFTVCMVTTLVKIVMSSSESSSLDEPSVSSTSLPSLSKSMRVLLLLGVRGAQPEDSASLSSSLLLLDLLEAMA